MKTQLIGILLMLAAMACANAKSLMIVPDLSASVPLLDKNNVKFAKSAALAAIDKFDQLKTGDRLTFRTLGETGLKNIGAISETVKRHKKRQRKKLYQRIAKIPEQGIEGQQATNILYFLTYTNFDCAGGEEIFLISDGIESSSVITDRKLLSGSPLPKPEPDMLKGCHLTIYGLGLGKKALPDSELKNLISAWKNWSKIAGLDLKIVVNP